MLTVTKEFTWDCAHMLEGHEGLCSNLHGHTYKMHVEVKRRKGLTINDGPSEGMVVDFKDLKEIVKELIVDPLDHACVINTFAEEKEERLGELLEDMGLKIYEMHDRPTAENMAIEFSAKLKNVLYLQGDVIQLVSLTVWETPTSFAKVT